ncbi:MAG: hypothetical protein IJ338_10700 [Bacteroidaceae bacterium]|nr:hypothetical protein [Bacteroidaceae bacterium]
MSHNLNHLIRVSNSQDFQPVTNSLFKQVGHPNFYIFQYFICSVLFFKMAFQTIQVLTQQFVCVFIDMEDRLS